MPTATSSSWLAAERATNAMALGRESLAERLLTTTSSPLTTESIYSHTSGYTSASSLSEHLNLMVATTTSTTTMLSLIPMEEVASSSIPPPPPPSPPQLFIDELSHSGSLIHALLASFSLILVSELGDKTFIITAIMAMKNSRSLVFLSSAFALFLMTVLSVGMGVAVTVIPELYTHYASIVLFLCFGLKMLKEAYDLQENKGEESEFDEVKRSLEVGEPPLESELPADKQDDHDDHDDDDHHHQVSLSTDGEKKAPLTKPSENSKPSRWRRCVQTLHVAPVCIKVFTMIFVAEWGDRSQISTVILAAREDVVGVFIGSLSGHVFCTGLAVIGGRFVADMISVRTLTFLGGCIFLFFATFAIVMGPQ